MSGAVPGQLLVQKATNCCPKILFAKRGTMQRYHCGIQEYAGHTEKSKGYRRLLAI